MPLGTKLILHLLFPINFFISMSVITDDVFTFPVMISKAKNTFLWVFKKGKIFWGKWVVNIIFSTVMYCSTDFDLTEKCTYVKFV